MAEPKIFCSYTKLVAPDDLKPNPANPNRHPDSQVDLLAKLITSHGWRHPVTVSSRSGCIVSGHCRLLAAKKLGLEHIPVDEQDFASEAEEMAVLVADNKIPELSETDGLMMADILCELDQVNYPLELTALSPAEIEDYVVGPTEPNPQDDVIPEPPKKAKTKTGDLYILGDHRLLCGDSTKAEDVERLMDGQKARYGMFDPPYGISVIGGMSKGSIGGMSKTKANIYTTIKGDDKPFNPSPFFYFAPEILWWGANYYANYLPPRKSWIVWDKKGRDWNDNFSDCEMAWTPFNCVARIYRHVWMGLVQEGEREIRVHPTQKPVGLYIRIIEDYFTDDGIIGDLFLGSGTTLITCEKLNRRCFGMEIDPIYCDVIVNRWQDFTGRKAELIKDKLAKVG